MSAERGGIDAVLYAKDHRQFRKMMRIIRKSRRIDILVNLNHLSVLTTHEGREYILDRL